MERPTQLPPRSQLVLDVRIIHQLAFHKTLPLLLRPTSTELVRPLLAAPPFLLPPSQLERLLFQVETGRERLIAVHRQLEEERLHDLGLAARGDARGLAGPFARAQVRAAATEDLVGETLPPFAPTSFRIAFPDAHPSTNHRHGGLGEGAIEYGGAVVGGDIRGRNREVHRGVEEDMLVLYRCWDGGGRASGLPAERTNSERRGLRGGGHLCDRC